jgi:hypothetical protein
VSLDSNTSTISVRNFLDFNETMRGQSYYCTDILYFYFNDASLESSL